MNLKVKDALYYSDLMYELKSLAGFEQQENEETEERIIERSKSIVEEQKTGPFRYLNKLSIFQQELFEIVSGISKKAGVTFRSLSAISKYPELVNEVLSELENKKKMSEETQKFDVLAVPNSRNNAFVVSSEEAKKLSSQNADSESIQEISRRAEEFKTNNLSQEQNGPRLVKKLTPPKQDNQ